MERIEAPEPWVARMIGEIRCKLCVEFAAGQRECQWKFSSEQDLAATIYRIAREVCEDRIKLRDAWLGLEAQPTWFLHEEGREFFSSFGFSNIIPEMQSIMQTALSTAGYTHSSRPRFDLALLSRRENDIPHLHLWETKFFSLGARPNTMLVSAKKDAERIVTFARLLAKLMHISGEVIWVDPYSLCSTKSWHQIQDALQQWNTETLSVPIRLWTYVNEKPFLVGFEHP